MLGPTAQLVALACHLNAIGRGLRVAPFFPINSTCQFCDFVRFVRRRRTWWRRAGDWTLAAPTPDAWLMSEARAGRSGFIRWQGSEDRRFPDRVTAGLVGGGGRWLLFVDDDKQRDVWEASWEVGNREAPDQRIWRVTYGLVSEGDAVSPPDLRTLDALRQELAETLSQVEAFARRHGLEHFADCFRKAVECLSADDPFALVYHKDLAPAGLLDVRASQLLAAAQAAWVFGGMGSWNDLGFDGEDQATYEKLSGGLFALLNESICAATNSAAVSHDHRGSA